MNTEQKAKAYDEALEKARQIHNADRVSGIELTTCEEIFPELKESEDERTRKALIYRYQGDGCICTNEYRIDYKDIRAWLEKQKVRSPLSKDEEYTLARIIEYLEDNVCPSEWKDLLLDVYALPYQKEQKLAGME